MLQAGRKWLRRIWMSLRRFIGFVFKRDGRWWIVLIVATVAVGVGLSWRFWEILHGDDDSLSTTISNLSFVLGCIVAIELALWRSIVGERQTVVAQQQAETARRDMLNQLLQKGDEMLGSSIVANRLGGIYALRHLATEHPEQYHVQVMAQLCAFIRGATGADGQPTAAIEEIVFSREEILSISPDREDAPPENTVNRFVARSDIQEAMNVIAFCHDKNLAIETVRNYWLNLRGADLRGLDLSDMNLSREFLNFRRITSFQQAMAIGHYTDMRRTKMADASLIGTNLSRVDLSEATGLTQDRFILQRLTLIMHQNWMESMMPIPESQLCGTVCLRRMSNLVTEGAKHCERLWRSTGSARHFDFHLLRRIRYLGPAVRRLLERRGPAAPTPCLF